MSAEPAQPPGVCFLCHQSKNIRSRAHDVCAVVHLGRSAGSYIRINRRAKAPVALHRSIGRDTFWTPRIRQFTRAE